MRILFFGTPDFAVPSLSILVESEHDVAAVVTAPDKPAGRGLKMQATAVKEFAVLHGLNVLQPVSLKNPQFIQQLKKLKPDLQVVVAFRMLPEAVWQLPPKGTFNLHASLLPQYRGAAPINRAIINGEKETGVTTFFLRHEIDTGTIIFQEKTAIDVNETAGELHNRLMTMGADLVAKTVKAIDENNYKTIDQHKLFDNESELQKANKLFRDDGRINWKKPALAVHNHIRGLSPYPAAFTEFVAKNSTVQLVKIFRSALINKPVAVNFCGVIETDGKSFLHIACADEWISVTEIQLPGKKKMPVGEFLRGFHLNQVVSVK